MSTPGLSRGLAKAGPPSNAQGGGPRARRRCGLALLRSTGRSSRGSSVPIVDIGPLGPVVQPLANQGERRSVVQNLACLNQNARANPLDERFLLQREEQEAETAETSVARPGRATEDTRASDRCRKARTRSAEGRWREESAAYNLLSTCNSNRPVRNILTSDWPTCGPQHPR